MDPILIADYDPAWPEAFARERDAIVAALGEATRGVGAIEHVGSTAVPGLAAKPVIDIMIGVHEPEDGQRCVGPIVGLGYEYLGEHGIPGRCYFRKGDPRTHHVHLVEHDSEFWLRHILFRDLLRERTDLAEQYGAIKRRLAFHHGTDRAAYTEAKSPFIEGALAEVSGGPRPATSGHRTRR